MRRIQKFGLGDSRIDYWSRFLGRPYGTRGFIGGHDTPDFFVPLGLGIRGYIWVILHEQDSKIWFGRFENRLLVMIIGPSLRDKGIFGRLFTPDFFIPLGLVIRGYTWVILHGQDSNIWSGQFKNRLLVMIIGSSLRDYRV
jgi:hypothetical protein